MSLRRRCKLLSTRLWNFFGRANSLETSLEASFRTSLECRRSCPALPCTALHGPHLDGPCPANARNGKSADPLGQYVTYMHTVTYIHKRQKATATFPKSRHAAQPPRIHPHNPTQPVTNFRHGRQTQKYNTMGGSRGAYQHARLTEKMNHPYGLWRMSTSPSV